MKRNRKKNTLALLCMLFSFAVTAQLPAKIQGNWITADGGNQFIIGIYKQVVCYDNSVWAIQSVTPQNDHWLLALETAGKSVTLDIAAKDSGSILVTYNNKQQLLRNYRTYNYRYKPVEQPFRRPFFTRDMATLTGYFQLPALRKRNNESYLQLSSEEELTGEANYYFADIDSMGRFSTSFPVYKPQFCTIKWGGGEIATVLVQPGSQTLICYNNDINVVRDNPDYNELMQRVCFMGDNGDFNNQYQHFIAYSVNLGYPRFEFPFATIKGKTVAEKKELQHAYYKNLYAKCTTALNQLYTPGKASRRFISYMTDELKYTCAMELLNNLRDQYGEATYGKYKIDSSDLKILESNFLEQESPDALIHPSFYKLASRYASQVMQLETGGRFSYSYSLEEMDKRIETEYGPNLSGNFLEIYRQIKKDRMAISKMKEPEIIQKYFKGNREEAMAYQYLQRKISDEFYKEAKDSANYVYYKRRLTQPLLRFAANVSQLRNEGFLSDDVEIPSIHRIALFREYSNLIGTPWRLVDTLATSQAVDLALASLSVKLDGSLITEVNTEADWQNSLKKYRGKVVVIWAFSHYFTKENVERSIYELKKIKEMYKDRNVVFLKCIQQRQRSDRIKQLLNYMRTMKTTGELNDLFYIDRSLSMGALMEEAISDRCAIYNENGQAHHPIYTTSGTFGRRSETSLPRELDIVLSGNGRYLEEMADRIFKPGRPRDKNSYLSDRQGTWTLYATADNYYSYKAGTIDEPIYGKADSVFNILTFINDTIALEYKIVLHRELVRKNQSQLFADYRYNKELLNEGSAGWHFQFDGMERIIKLFDKKGSRQKQFRVVFISRDAMVLELIE